MKFAKMVKKVIKLGSVVAGFGAAVVTFADHIIHREEYERKKRRARIIKITLCVIGGIAAILLFPYKLVVEKNGDFEIRTLLLRIYRKSDEYDLPEGGSDSFDIEAVEDEEVIECEVVEAED